MIIGIEGPPRSGKGVLGTLLARNFHKHGYKGVANYKIRFQDGSRPAVARIEDIERAISESKSLNELYKSDKIFMVIDEFHLWADSRRAMSNDNITLSYLASQAGKRHITICWISQQNHSVEKRYREFTDVLWNCEKVLYRTLLPDGQLVTNALSGFRFEGVDMRPRTPKPLFFYITAKDAMPIFNAYSTEELITPLKYRKEQSSR